MKRIKSVTLALAMFLLLPNASSAETQSHRDAQAFVSQAQFGRNLPGIALSVAQQTVTFAVIAKKLGRAGASTAVSKEIKALLPKYQPMWDQNIVLAYEKFFSPEELASLAKEFRSSRYVPKVMAQQSDIGREMDSTSKPILKDLVTEALNATFSNYPPDKL